MKLYKSKNNSNGVYKVIKVTWENIEALPKEFYFQDGRLFLKRSPLKKEVELGEYVISGESVSTSVSEKELKQKFIPFSPVVRVAITGTMRSGKDTVAEIIKKHFQVRGLTVNLLSFGSTLKEFAHDIFYEVPNSPKPRELYQTMNLLKKYDNDVWVKHLSKKLKEVKEGVTIITDLRHLNEASYLREQGFTIIKVTSSREEIISRLNHLNEEVKEDYFNNKSEQEVQLIDEDYLIDNSGINLKQLEELTIGVMKKQFPNL